jgi:hypothetical protein
LKYTENEIRHSKILSNLAVASRSSRDYNTPIHFTDTTRLNAIREELKNSDYFELHIPESDGGCYSLWGKVPLEELKEPVILVSTHVDTVPSITEPFSTLEENGFYHGTYDNLGTNAAAVISMLEGDLPENILFAFTGDEETGYCEGALGAARILKDAGITPVCVALDVTYEGFVENRLFSLENLTSGQKNNSFLDFVISVAFFVEPLDTQSFCFVPIDCQNLPKMFSDMSDYLTRAYRSPQYGMMDEAFAYAEENLPAMSVCLPCKGYMHSNSGVFVKQPVFEGYVLSLQCFLKELSREDKREFNLPFLQISDKLSQLVKRAGEISLYEREKNQKGESGYFHNFDLDYDD